MQPRVRFLLKLIQLSLLLLVQELVKLFVGLFMQVFLFFLSRFVGKAAVLPYLFSRGKHLFEDGFDFDLLIGAEIKPLR